MNAMLFAKRLAGWKQQLCLQGNYLRVRSDPVHASWIRKIMDHPFSLEVEQLRQLREAGFVFAGTDSRWIDQYVTLADFQRKHGHCRVTGQGTSDARLGSWVSIQRTAHHRGLLTPPRRRALQRLGFIWDLQEASWETHTRELKAFIAQHGHARVSCKAGSSLAVWVGNMRQRRKHLSASKKCQLDKLGFEWNPFETDWKSGLEELRRFHARYGHGNVPAKSKTHPKAGPFIQQARQGYHEGTLSRERRQQLEALRVDWNPKATLWQRRFDELKAVIERLGHARLCKAVPKNKTLVRWARYQREIIHRLPKDKQAQLRKIGFPMDPQKPPHPPPKERLNAWTLDEWMQNTAPRTGFD